MYTGTATYEVDEAVSSSLLFKQLFEITIEYCLHDTTCWMIFWTDMKINFLFLLNSYQLLFFYVTQNNLIQMLTSKTRRSYLLCSPSKIRMAMWCGARRLLYAILRHAVSATCPPRRTWSRRQEALRKMTIPTQVFCCRWRQRLLNYKINIEKILRDRVLPLRESLAAVGLRWSHFSIELLENPFWLQQPRIKLVNILYLMKINIWN